MTLFLFLGTFQIQGQIITGPIPISLAPCAGITVDRQVCNRDGTVTIYFRVDNNSGSTVTLVNVLDGTTVVGTSTTPIPPNSTGSHVYTYTGATPNSIQCFNLYLFNDRGGCCHRRVCVRVRDCCDLQTRAFGRDATCPTGLGSAGISVWGGTPPYTGQWTNTTTGQTGNMNIGGPISILLPNLTPGVYTYWFIDAMGCRVQGTFTIGTDFVGDNCLDFEIHDTASDYGWSNGLQDIYDGTSEVAATLNFCFTTVYAPDQLIVRVNNQIVLDSGPWSTLGTDNGTPTGSHGTCSPNPWGPQGAFFGQVTVQPCDVIDIDVDVEVCNAGGVGWTLDVSCGRLDCDNDGSSARGGAEERGASGRSDDTNLGSAGSFKLFPNPVTDVLNITNINQNYAKVRVLDGTGRTMMLDNSGETNLQMDASALQSGVYFVEITDDEGNRVVEKFIKL